MRTIILLGTFAIVLPFIISQAANSFGNAVSQRFLERPTRDSAPKFTIPLEASMGKPLGVASLSDWVRDENQLARGYATRVIPLDILYLIFLGTFLGFASTTLAGLIDWPRSIAGLPSWVWWMLPSLYLFSDFAEDSFIFTMLNWPSTIQGIVFDTLTCLRSIKIWSVTLAFAQVLLLGLLSYI